MKKQFEAPRIDFVTIAADDIMNLKSGDSTDGGEFLDYNALLGV